MAFISHLGRCIVASVGLVLVSGLAFASDFLVIGDGVTESSITPLLTASGNNVSLFPGTDVEFDGTVDLSSFDAVILLDGEGYSDGMPVSGQSSLKDYVIGGGGILLTEWVAFEFSEGRYSQMGELIPLRRRAGNTSTDTYTVTMDHEITAGLPASFSVPAQGFNVGTAVSGDVLVVGALADDAVVVDDVGAGRVVQLSTAGNYLGYRPFDQGAASDNFNRLFVQAAEWVASGKCFAIDAIDDQFGVINDGTTANFAVLTNDECNADTPISVVVQAGDLLPDRGGSATTDGDTVNYTPAAGFVGFEQFTYTAQDAGLEGGADPPAVDRDTAVVVVNVLENLIPDAVDDAVTALQDQPLIIDVLANDWLGNAPNTVEIETEPANGSATVQPDNSIQYSPSFNFFGEDSFEYRLTDANGDSDVATVTVGVFFIRGQVSIDIMPKSDGNNLNLRAGQRTGIDVAILSAGEFFQAPILIDPLTLKFGPREGNIWGSPQVRDVDGDGDDDLVVKFLILQSGIACGDSHATVFGSTFGSQSISGSDAINTFNCPRVRKRH
jgi:hypothetical protein